MTEQTQTKLEIWAEDIDLIDGFAQKQGAEIRKLPPKFGIEPLTISVIVIGTAAAVGMVTNLVEHRRGGQVVDLTGSTPSFRRDRGVVFGLIVILLKDGKVSIEVKEPKGLIGQVLEAVTSIVKDLAKQSIDTAVKSVEGVVGEKGTVKKL